MNIDKVANTPPLTMSEGWPAKDTALSDNQEATFNEGVVKTGGGANLSEEQPERHNIAEASPASAHRHVPACPSFFPPVDPKPPSTRLPAIQKDDAEDSDSDDPNQRQALGSKTASFYIGGDEARSPTLKRERKGSQGTPAAPWKVPGEGTTVVEFTPPDGGYSWVVALAACFINLWIIGFTKSYGVLYVAIREAFPEASAYHISWLPSLLSTVGLLTGQLFPN